MSSLSERGEVVALRGLLRERFPEACRGVERMVVGDGGGAEEVEVAGEVGETGLELGVGCVDAAGVRKGEVVEVVGGGGGVVVWGICRVEGRRVALVDGADGFDPQDAGAGVCRRVLWVRCREVAVAVKAADLLLRDGNLPVVVMDLGMCGVRELGRVAGSSWFRLRSLAEATGAVLVVVTPRACVGCADVRVEVLAAGWGLEGMERPRQELVAELEGRVVKRRGGVVEKRRAGDIKRAG